MTSEIPLINEIPAQLCREEILMEYKYFRSLCLMTRGVTHDYNNIFTGLSGQVKLIGQEAGNRGIAEHRLQMVEDLLIRGVSRTSTLYEFARYTQAAKSAHSVERILDLSIESLNILSRSHQFLVEKQEGLPRLYCHLKDMVMLLFYLGENALEAMPEGGSITVSAGGEGTGGEAIIFSVHNQGRGISPVVRDSLFQPFITTKTSRQGLQGLGLYAAHSIVRQHGGTMSFSDDKNGTIFSARIPMIQPVTDRVTSKESEAVLTRSKQPAELRQSKETFFVVEDDDAMRDLIVSSLQRRGHVVFSAETCADAVDDFEFVHEAVTVLLIDIGLTDGDGLECMKKMTAISAQPRVVFMSGEDVDEREIVKYNAMFLKKPFTVKDIEELVKHAK